MEGYLLYFIVFCCGIITNIFWNHLLGLGTGIMMVRTVISDCLMVVAKNVQSVYEINELILPKINDLELIHQNDIDRDLIREWIAAFINECDMNPNIDSFKEADRVLKKHVKTKGFRFLKRQDGELVSMAAKHREFENYATISLVYTPPKYRKNGYGKAVTALLAKEL